MTVSPPCTGAATIHVPTPPHTNRHIHLPPCTGASSMSTHLPTLHHTRTGKLIKNSPFLTSLESRDRPITQDKSRRYTIWSQRTPNSGRGCLCFLGYELLHNRDRVGRQYNGPTCIIIMRWCALVFQKKWKTFFPQKTVKFEKTDRWRVKKRVNYA